jgi:hypothetical protein
VALTPDQEVALGLQAAPQMAAEFGGLHPDPAVQDYVASGNPSSRKARPRAQTTRTTSTSWPTPRPSTRSRCPAGRSSSPRRS